MTRTRGLTERAELAPWGFFAAVLAAAGLPIYIHAPKFFADNFGVGLAAMGGVLFVLRLVDLVQDPLLGWLAARLSPRARGPAVALALTLLMVGMLALFAVRPPIAPLWWFALTLTLLFSAWSFLTIVFYSTGVARAQTLGPSGHLRLAGWREAGGLLGVCLAALAPAVLALIMAAPFAGFAFGFAVLCVVAGLLMRGQWAIQTHQPGAASLRAVLRDPATRWLLAIALLNAAPLAVTATLFLFFVESVLQAPGWEGPLLVLYFLAAALSAPFWSRAADRLGARVVLLGAMALALVAFGFALRLGPGDAPAFAVVCIATGAALGADMVILPALFARRMAQVAPNAAVGFGLWSFASKACLSLAAVTLLPLLERAGFAAGATTPPQSALRALSLAYAGLPLVLKSIAAVALIAAPLQRS